MIGVPPFDTGAVKTTVTCVLPAVTLLMVGAPGTVAPTGITGVTLLEATEAGLLPTELVAVTVKV